MTTPAFSHRPVAENMRSRSPSAQTALLFFYQSLMLFATKLVMGTKIEKQNRNKNMQAFSVAAFI